MPGSGSAIATSSSEVLSRKRVSVSILSKRSAVTSAFPKRANRTTRPGQRAEIAATRESSAFATKVPAGRRPSRISAFACASSSIESKFARWAGATLVIAATSGSNARESRDNSPFALIPISPIIQSGIRGRLTTDIGKPIALFWLPGVFSTANRRDRIVAVNSFVVVFPEEPVIAASRNFARVLRRIASAVRAVTGSGTTTTGTRWGSAEGTRSPRIARAPRATASGAKS